MESEKGIWLRRLIEKAGKIATLRQRREASARSRAKAAAEAEETRIALMLDDCASILGLRRDHPKVIVAAIYALNKEDRDELPHAEIDRDDVGYKSEFGSDW